MYFFSLRCDADPVALTKYVLALIKKDKAETELRDSMEQQMEVFLQENTAEFIDSLFKTLSGIPILFCFQIKFLGTTAAGDRFNQALGCSIEPMDSIDSISFQIF